MAVSVMPCCGSCPDGISLGIQIQTKDGIADSPVALQLHHALLGGLGDKGLLQVSMLWDGEGHIHERSASSRLATQIPLMCVGTHMLMRLLQT